MHHDIASQKKSPADLLQLVNCATIGFTANRLGLNDEFNSNEKLK